MKKEILHGFDVLGKKSHLDAPWADRCALNPAQTRMCRTTPRAR